MKKLNKIYDDICTIMDTENYYTKEEVKEMREDFISAMQSENKEDRKQYTDFLQEQITSIRPVEKSGVYDFELEKEIESIIEQIINY